MSTRRRAASGRATPSWVWWTSAVAVAVLSTCLKLPFLSQPVSGYHGFNEGYYTDLAARYAARGLLTPWTAPQDLMNPPLYLALVTAVSKVFGPGVAGARWVSIAAAAGAAIALFGLVRVLYNERIALMSAAAFALAPGVVLVGRNAQIDTLMVALELAALWLYALAVREDDPRLGACAGAVLGAALLAKLPAVLTIGVIVLWHLWWERDWKRLRSPVTWWTVGGLFVVGAPWFVVQLARAGRFLAAQLYQAKTLSGLETGGQPFWQRFGVEFMGMMTPIVLALALGGLFVALRRRTPADVLIVCGLGVNLLFYVFFHFHTYYLLPQAPFAAMLAARGMDTLWADRPRRVAIAVAVLAAVLAFSSVLLLGTKKWGHWGPAYVDSDMDRVAGHAERVTLHVVSSIPANSFGPAFERDVRRTHVVYEPLRETDRVVPGSTELALIPRYVMAASDIRPSGSPRVTRYRPVLFGFAIDVDPGELHFFATGPVRFVRVGPVWRFGVDAATADHSKWAYYPY